ncbi:MAG: diaminopimelate decarboxylase [Gemmatimonadetes bacterium]|nr:diaminopimelate decarboxylase [Gemmatimonadota bacterium]
MAGELCCGGLTLRELADRFGTPLYVYNGPAIDERYLAFERAFASVDRLVAYSVKANANLAVLRRLAALGSGADIVSRGELHRALLAGIEPRKIVFAGVGKTEAEMRAALEAGIYSFNVESAGELDALSRVAAALGVEACFALRVNPDIVSPTPHAYTRTGHLETKFGIPVGETLELYRWARGVVGLRAAGIDVHIGSQIADPEPYARAVSRVLELVGELRGSGIELEYVDMGGGFAIRYGGGEAMDLVSLAQAVAPRVAGTGLKLVVEPGRYLVGEAGMLITRVLYVKRTDRKTFVVTDAGMSELLRPSHYGGYHEIELVMEQRDRSVETVDVVGPVCETGDFLALDRPLPVPQPGELLAVRQAGAYGFTMTMNYNGRLRPAEVLVEDARACVVRRRETLDDLVRGEVDLWV